MLSPVDTKPPILGYSSFRDMDSIGKNTPVYPGTPTSVIQKAFFHWYIQPSHMH
jgi:hypothetical protein